MEDHNNLLHGLLFREAHTWELHVYVVWLMFSDKVSVERKKKGCPAVTLRVEMDHRHIDLDFVLGLEVHSSSWPLFTKDGFKIENWLGKQVKKNLKLKPYYLVAKYEGTGTTEQNGVRAKGKCV